MLDRYVGEVVVSAGVEASGGLDVDCPVREWVNILGKKS